MTVSKSQKSRYSKNKVQEKKLIYEGLEDMLKNKKFEMNDMIVSWKYEIFNINNELIQMPFQCID